ncbi:hypothetical protein CI109_103032 [Kwoniella shandongensis]|uniref:Uncharacterized protein n=1 Tax=Kwoniella shandongensis TaxID=1734106 RepID=A0A5M6CE17_9TREE|nr:uncharacterized protein CI109_000220 [Kwoniella shandongensis]KAA5531379.1 hypothetical protein CI109_000220 [Kwoniella shandongensis]
MELSTLPTSLPTITLLIENMHCTSCCEAINYLLSHFPSVKGVTTSLLLRTVTFTVDTSESTSTSPTTVRKVLKDVTETLTNEGGFVVVAESANGNGTVLPSTNERRFRRTGSGAKNDNYDEQEGWLSKLALLSKRGREKQMLRNRRKKHLEHCEECKEQLRQQTLQPNGQHVAPTSLSSDEAPLDSPSHSPISGANPMTQNSFSPIISDDAIVKTTLSIEGMTCASCTSSITSALKSEPTVIEININLLSSSGMIRHQASLSPSDLVSLVEDVGFDVQVISSIPETSVPNTAKVGGLYKSVFSIGGMTCASCSNSITTVLQDVKGVENVHVDLLGNRATIIHNSDITTDEIKTTIEDAGFDADLSLTEPVKATQTVTDQPKSRTVQILVEGLFCNECVKKINDHLSTLPLISYKAISLHSPVITVEYVPHQPLTIRQILVSLSDLAEEFDSEVVKTQSLNERSQKIQKKEVRILASHCLVAIIFAIPTFVIAIVGMILVRGSSSLKMSLMRPVWGAANLGTIILWPLATVVQFGVGRLFYERAFASMWPHLRALLPSFLRRKSTRRIAPRPLTWRTLFSFGSMDLLVVLSTTVSYFASIAMLILDVQNQPDKESVGTYFDSCVFLIMFILVGRSLEAYAKSKTTDAVSLLGTLRPDTALLLGERENTDISRVVSMSSAWTDMDSDDVKGQTETPTTTQRPVRPVPVSHLEIGDTILIQPGSLPPTDGTILTGETTFDESSLTGESKPIHKSSGDLIFTGTVNKTSAITVRVDRLAGDTMLEKIISAVSDASSRKAPLEKLAERLTGVFVPIIVYLSLVVLAVWLPLSLTGVVDTRGKGGGAVFFALEFAIATLVVACPCGIGLAVPCANAVGNGIAAKAGILASGGGEAFLAATKVDRVVFDKTGTLTEGKSLVTDALWISTSASVSDGDVELVKRGVEEVERGSTHPLAVGLIEHLEKRPRDSEDVSMEIVTSTEVAGRGLKAQVKIGERALNLLIGNVALMEYHNVELDITAKDAVTKWSAEAKSVILVASRVVAPKAEQQQSTSSSTAEVDMDAAYTLKALFSLSDPPRPTSAALIASLRERGMKVSMLSGDNETTAKAVGKMIGLDGEGEVRGGVGPEGKAEVIRVFQGDEGKKEVVMFVGDGLNDSVALAAADVSVAMGHGSQATLASADFILLSSSLPTLLTLLAISKKVINRQRLNLLWALLFNVICLPFAAGVFYAAGGKGIRLSPVWSAVLMALSSVSVVMSSLAMRWGL